MAKPSSGGGVFICVFMDAIHDKVKEDHRYITKAAYKDVYLFCTAGLCGMMQAIQVVFPQSRLQRCVVVSRKDIKQVASLRRMLYLASQRIVKHWHARRQNRDLALSQLRMMFADRAV